MFCRKKHKEEKIRYARKKGSEKDELFRDYQDIKQYGKKGEICKKKDDFSKKKRRIELTNKYNPV